MGKTRQAKSFIEAMVEAESFVELSSRKVKFDFSKPKKTGNDGNGKNGGNEKSHNGKWKPKNKLNGPMKCLICNGPHIIRDYPKKSIIFVIEGDGQPDKASIRLEKAMGKLGLSIGKLTKKIKTINSKKDATRASREWIGENITGCDSKHMTNIHKPSYGGELITWGSFNPVELARFVERMKKSIYLKPWWSSDTIVKLELPG
ncbi:hypothetical protein J1N35_037697 [Gossypium stocksii]|uniref:Uncharacterized protein n=1 Tax=Gossypium stocksii TaxID=47602 RepID=A0A9D3UKT4_9ROSI|nr:hypothetical protein J1N35_037697 [Gossypium stocksii]